METSSTSNGAAYPPPLDRLLGLGEMGARHREWHDYTAMGFTAEHVPDLLRMASDDELHGAKSEDPRVYAPLHAWRALGQLRAAEAAAPLAELLLRHEDDDWAKEDIPRALGMIGEPALEPARAVLANASAAPFTRVAAASALHEAALRHPQLRDRAVSLLIDQLGTWPEQDDSLNGFLIDYLVELRAVEAAPLMQAAFEGGMADPDIRGDWEDVQVDLGLLEKRLTPPPPPAWLSRLEDGRRVVPQPGPPAGSGKAVGNQKNRRKAEKQARKRNRRK